MLHESRPSRPWLIFDVGQDYDRSTNFPNSCDVCCGRSRSGSIQVCGRKHVPNGDYIPDPKQRWHAGEVITISGTRFRWGYFTDDISHTPKPQEGVIRFFPDHIVLEGLKWDPKRIPGVLDGVPVLWTEKGYAEWKKSGRITALYLEKK